MLGMHFFLSCHMLVLPTAETQGEPLLQHCSAPAGETLPVVVAGEALQRSGISLHIALRFWLLSGIY